MPAESTARCVPLSRPPQAAATTASVATLLASRRHPGRPAPFRVAGWPVVATTTGVWMSVGASHRDRSGGGGETAWGSHPQTSSIYSGFIGIFTLFAGRIRGDWSRSTSSTPHTSHPSNSHNLARSVCFVQSCDNGPDSESGWALALAIVRPTAWVGIRAHI